MNELTMAKWIKNIREENNLNQSELGSLMSIEQSSISRWEKISHKSIINESMVKLLLLSITRVRNHNNEWYEHKLNEYRSLVLFSKNNR